ncbi:signal peptide peptidase SppA [Butyribacter intestini]|jgi:protease-4|uniref:Signal peptide peptidase SppA n=1 Tax=Butyribacter intestini TaxID=1703332 RepID=A0AAW3JRP7_9FIRM|nr:signal peptide peptidase SppA [Butyribacter intestini]KQC85402.1 signal peptide peptidase SppA [Butyribacter intestini]RHU74684.1 signal peptide peptidase SppA [Butyribacter intestini]
MKTKQIISIVITGVVIIAVGITGVASNVIGSKLIKQNKTETSSIVKDMFSSVSGDSNIELPNKDFVGVINIEGEIGASSSNSLTSDSTYNHDFYLKYIEKMEQSDKNKGILLYVDSPGGAVYESDEMYLKLMEYKEKTKRPIWAYFASQACSGGYYISMAADKIYANRNCWTGSIGVIVSLTNCKKLYDKLGIKEIDITSGKNKAMGSQGLELTKEQRGILQSLVDEAYDQFVGIVADGRKMDKSAVKKIADGRIYSAKQAKEINLVDEVGSLKDEKKAFAKEAGFSEDITYYTPEKDSLSGMFSSIFGAVKDIVPKSDIDLAEDIVKNNGNGVLKYYAK